MRRLLPLLLMWCLTIGVAAQPERGAHPPNVVLIMADDIGVEGFSCYGSDSCDTPRIDALAARGVRFEHAHSQPLCTPSRVQLMTGLSNARNYTAFSVLDPNAYTIGHLMRDAGYATGVFGKWQLTGAAHYPEGIRGTGMRPEDAGFDTHLLWQVDDLGSRYWSPRLVRDGELLDADAFAGRFGADVFVDAIEAFIDAHSERAPGEPFFVYYPAVLVHDPFVPVPTDDAPHPRNDRAAGSDAARLPAMVEYLDAVVGRIEDHLADRGMLDQTVIVFTADNGTHRSCTLRRAGQPVRGGKGTTLDTGTHVPLVVAGPGIAVGLATDRLAGFTDVLPTLAAIAGVDLAASGRATDGVSLLPLLQGEDATPRDHVYVWYHPRPQTRPNRPPLARYVRDARWSLYADGRLFDNHADPQQQAPLSPGAAPDADAARARLQPAMDAAPRRTDQP